MMIGMLGDKKKQLTKMYVFLTVITLLLIVALFFIDNKLNSLGISSSILEYSKGILFGIFAGILTGLAIAFYEYRQQVYSDLYSYIKQTRECVDYIKSYGTSKSFQFCVFQIIHYQKSVSSIFVIRKLRRNNIEIINLLVDIKKDFESAYTKCSTLNNELHTIYLKQEQLNQSKEQLFTACCSTPPKPNLHDIIDNKTKEIDMLNNTIKLNEEQLEILWDQTAKLLDSIYCKSQTLYDYVNSSRKIFFI